MLLLLLCWQNHLPGKLLTRVRDHVAAFLVHVLDSTALSDMPITNRPSTHQVPGRLVSRRRGSRLLQLRLQVSQLLELSFRRSRQRSDSRHVLQGGRLGLLLLQEQLIQQLCNFQLLQPAVEVRHVVLCNTAT